MIDCHEMESTVGFIGLGNMGQGMVSNLLAKGTDLTVYTRTRAKIVAAVEKGARGASSLGELAAGVDIVLACLPDVQTSREVFLGDGGMLTDARAGQIFVDHSTVDITTSRSCAEVARRSGAFFLDAPISGGPDGAAAGTLTIMVGGDQDAYNRTRPQFKKMGTRVERLGPTGAGTAMKLINQLLVGVHTVAAAEAFALANSAGVDLSVVAEILRVSWGASRMTERNAPVTRARAFANSPTPVRTLHKDLSIITALATEANLSLPLGTSALHVFESLLRQGKGDQDIASVIETIEGS